MDYQYWVDFVIMSRTFYTYVSWGQGCKGNIQNLQNQGSCVLGNAHSNDDTTNIHWIQLCTN